MSNNVPGPSKHTCIPLTHIEIHTVQLYIEGFHLSRGMHVNGGRIVELYTVQAQVSHCSQTNYIFFSTEWTDVAIKLPVCNQQQPFDILMLKLSSGISLGNPQPVPIARKVTTTAHGGTTADSTTLLLWKRRSHTLWTWHALNSRFWSYPQATLNQETCMHDQIYDRQEKIITSQKLVNMTHCSVLKGLFTSISPDAKPLFWYEKKSPQKDCILMENNPILLFIPLLLQLENRGRKELKEIKCKIIGIE